MQTKTYAAFAGIRNTLPTERLERAANQSGNRDIRTDLVEATNVDIDDSGRVSRRAGFTAIVSGPGSHSIWSNGVDICLFVRDGTLYQLRADFSTVALMTGLDALTMRYIQVNDRVYFMNGVQSGILADDVIRPWGMSVQNYQPQATVIAGQLAGGAYQYAATFIDVDGQESGTGLAERITVPDGGGLHFTWPAATDKRIESIAIYLSDPNSETMYLALTVPIKQLSANFIGGVLATPLNTQWFDAPPQGHDITYHRGRIIIASGAFLYGTAALGYGYVDLRDYLALDNTTISFVIGATHGIYVGTEKSVYFLKGDNLMEMTLEEVVASHGVAGSAIVVDGFVATGDDARAGDECILFATGLGICLGSPDGAVVNLTYDRFQTTMPRSGAAVLRTSQTQTQYLLTLHD